MVSLTSFLDLYLNICYYNYFYQYWDVYFLGLLYFYYYYYYYYYYYFFAGRRPAVAGLLGVLGASMSGR